MKNPTRIVTPYSVRPNRPDGTCFYCCAPLGDEHVKDCVILSRSVVVRFCIDLVLSTPEYNAPEDIEFRYNDGTWCADNLLTDIEDLQRRLGDGCLCNYIQAKYIREATENDHEGQAFEFAQAVSDAGGDEPQALDDDDVLSLSALVSNQVQRLTRQPVTESEDAELAMLISGWLKRIGAGQ